MLVRLLLTLALLTSSLIAQTSLGRIRGIVSDTSGGVIPGAQVTATNLETGVVTRTESSASGAYAFAALQPGTYTVDAGHTGFKRFTRKGIVLETADVLELNVELQIGEVTESVSVSADAPLLENTTSTIGQMVDARLIQEMPLNSRRSLNLIATTGTALMLSPGDQAVFSLAGGRTRDANFMLDGGNMQNIRMGLGQIDTDPPVAAVREFKVLSNNYSAEYGGSAGGVVLSTTRSGTNQFHGDAYEFFRNDALEAAYFFAPTEGTRKVKAPRRYDLFGGTFSGPVLINKTHFFFSYEGLRHSLGSTTVLTVPTDLQRSGDFSKTFTAAGALIPIYDPATQVTNGTSTTRQQFPGNTIPQTRFDAVSAAFIKYWPTANRPAINLAGAQNFAKNSAQRTNKDNIVGRIDHAIGNTNRFYARMVYQKDPVQNGSVYPYEIADTASAYRTERFENTLLFADTHTWTPALVMDTRYTYARRENHEMTAGLGSNVVQEVGLKGVPSGAFPQITVAGVAGIGFSRERNQFPIQQHQFINNWSWMRGAHFVRFGGEMRQSNDYERARPVINGKFDFTAAETNNPVSRTNGLGFASFLLGAGDAFSLNDSDQLDRYSWYYAGFLQDDWKISSTLTLNLGVRWEVDTPMRDRNNRMNSFDPHQINPVSGTSGVVKFLGLNGFPDTPYQTDWNNFGPRFGFAWQPGKKLWVVRGGFGVFFDHPLAHAAPNSNTLGFSQAANLSSPDSGVTPAFVFRNGIGVSLSSPVRDDSFGAVAPGKAPTTSVTFFEQNRKSPYSLQYNLSLQRQLPSDMVVETAYIANLSRKLPVADLALNQVPPALMASGSVQNRRPFPQFNGVAVRLPTIGMSNYHAAMMRVEKRLSHGLSFTSTYTLARNIGNVDLDSASDFGDNQNYQNFYARGLDKGPNAIDIIHRFTFSSVFDLPFGKRFAKGIFGGWTWGTIWTMQSGGPFTVTVSPDTTNAFAAGTQRANVLRNPNLPGDQRTVARWFDTSAFVAPPALTFGNAGRGIVRADGRVNFDMSVNKRFKVTERASAKLSGEFFNAFNHPDFVTPNRTLGNAAFGSISDATTGRVIQLGLHLTF